MKIPLCVHAYIFKKLVLKAALLTLQAVREILLPN